MDIRMCSRTSALGGRLLSRLGVLFSVPFLVVFLLVSAESGVLASPPGGDRSDVPRPRYDEADGQDESIRRVRVRTIDGIFLVYDADTRPITGAADTPSRNHAGYLAYWNDYLSEQLYVFERILLTRSDVGQALLNLELDLGIDSGVFVEADRELNQALIQALAESDDPTQWRPATRSVIRDAMEVPVGASGDPEPVCAPPTPRSVIDDDVVLLPSVPTLPVVTFPTAPKFGLSAEELIDSAMNAIDCDGPGGPGDIFPSCFCCIRLEFPEVNCCVDSCNDGSRCTTDDVCVDFTCIGILKDCDDGEPCTADSCDEETGSCVNRPCTDSDPCTDDECVDGRCEFPFKCEDNNECTRDTCDDGICVNEKLTGTPCDDDGNECTDDVCLGGSCTNVAYEFTRSCDEETPPNECTNDVCVGTTCKHLAYEFTRSCDEETPPKECTNDICSGTTCTHVAYEFTHSCEEDGNECSNDVCVGTTCKHLAYVFIRSCEPDEEECTKDECSGTFCDHPPKDDGTQCTPDTEVCTNDVCMGGSCDHIAYTVPPSCEDEIPPNECTDNVCEGTTCTHPPDREGLPCTPDPNECTDDVCFNGNCQHEEYDEIDRPCNDDGDACTDDICDGTICKHEDACTSRIAGQICCGDACCDPADCCQDTTCCSPAQDCCTNGVCCDEDCNGCADRGVLTGGTITVGTNPVCVGDAITFTAIDVLDRRGGSRLENCAEVTIPPVAPKYTWVITKPDTTTVTGPGPIATVVADLGGTYSVIFKATVDRLCAPTTPYDVGSASAEAADIGSVVWEEFDPASTPLDTCPNNGGRRIFPGKALPVDPSAGIRAKVALKATVSPIVQGCTVHFRVWDIDDPFDQNNPAMVGVGIIDANTTGPDNRGADPGVVTLSVVTDANGEARMTLDVSMQPGNNYRAGVSVDSAQIAATSQTQADTNSPPPQVVFTDMLTVWRTLHVELDSMESVTGNLVDVPFTNITGTATALTEVHGPGSLDDGSRDLDDTPPENGRFENGTLIIGTSPNSVTISPVTGNGNFSVAFPVATIAGLPFSAEDNDLFGNGTVSGTIAEITKSGSDFVWLLNVTANNESPIDWPDFVGGTLTVGGGANVTIVGADPTAIAFTTSDLNIPCAVRDDDLNTLLPKLPNTGQMAGAYAPAYVVPAFDVGDSNLAVPFVLNVQSSIDPRTVMDWDSRALNSPDFWIAYVLQAFQGDTADGDNDPNAEGGSFGITPGAGGGSLIFLEVHQSHEGVASPFLEEQDTLVHETGHAVGSNAAEPVTDGASNFTSAYLESIRASTMPDP